MILELIDEFVRAGGTEKVAVRRMGIAHRTVQRWRKAAVLDDLRCGPRTEPANKLSPAERAELLAAVNSEEFRDLPPSQIVPKLADEGKYIASESTMYRVLKEEDQAARRDRSKPPAGTRKPPERVATGANQVWSWDITYLKSPVRGAYYYLYMVMDVWSRKVVAAAVFDREDQELAAAVLEEAMRQEGVHWAGLAVHQDNGPAMKGLTFRAKMEVLGVLQSFSRPANSNDNPFSEALFRTMKYRPSYPDGAFASVEEAQAWVDEFVGWYNTVHLHSGITFTAPSDRHEGRDVAILEARRTVYAEAKARHPERWGSRPARAWKRKQRVALNPSAETMMRMRGAQAA